MGKHVAKKSASSRARRERARYDETEYGGYSDPQKPRRGQKKWPFIIIIVVVILIILAESAYLLFGHYYSKLNVQSSLTEDARASAIARVTEETLREEEEEPREGYEEKSAEQVDDLQAQIQAQLAAAGGSVMSNEDVINVLLIGSDARSRSELARSDVMMLISLNKNTHRIVLTSFMRDIYTYIPDYGYNRLNAPYAIAGADYLIETLEADFGIDIDNYAAVNFYDFADIIDAIGGVDLELTNGEVDFINEIVYGDQADMGVGTGAVWLDYSADGHYHLNGTQALAHCRNRRTAGSDADRTDRQRTVITAMINGAKSLSLSELNSLANVVLPMVTTDLSQGDCLSLILKAPEYLGYEVTSLRIPEVAYSFATINGMAVISIDFQQNAAVIQDAIYGG